jgi:Rad3-related DNA helicase
MRKVNQALGRLVRAPGQTARVLLHCRRFADEAYRNLLSTEYGDPPVLADDDEFARWATRS